MQFSDDDFIFSFSVRSVMHKHLMKMGEVTFDKIFNQKLGECPQLTQVKFCLLPTKKMVQGPRESV